jgi:hypothetical protein
VVIIDKIESEENTVKPFIENVLWPDRKFNPVFL